MSAQTVKLYSYVAEKFQIQEKLRSVTPDKRGWIGFTLRSYVLNLFCRHTVMQENTLVHAAAGYDNPGKGS
jgi:hypothetical protein